MGGGDIDSMLLYVLVAGGVAVVMRHKFSDAHVADVFVFVVNLFLSIVRCAHRRLLCSSFRAAPRDGGRELFAGIWQRDSGYARAAGEKPVPESLH